MFEPFEYQFFVRGILAATMVGGLCGLIGVYIVLKRMSYIGHGLSHAILGGAVVSFVLSINFLVGATVWGFLCAQLIALTAKKRKIAADAAIGVITTASFALGIVLISRYKSFTRDFEAALLSGAAPNLTHFASRSVFAGATFSQYLGIDADDDDLDVAHR